jgi:hypothetical protein
LGRASTSRTRRSVFGGNDNPNIAENQAFVLSDMATRETYAKAFAAGTGLYYGKPSPLMSPSILSPKNSNNRPIRPAVSLGRD